MSNWFWIRFCYFWSRPWKFIWTLCSFEPCSLHCSTTHFAITFYQKTWAAIPQWGDLGSSLDPGHRCALSCPGCIIWIWSLWLFQFISGLRMIEYANKKCKHFKHNITMKCVHIIWIFAHNMSFMDSRGSVLRLFIFLFHCCVYMC